MILLAFEGDEFADREQYHILFGIGIKKRFYSNSSNGSFCSSLFSLITLLFVKAAFPLWLLICGDLYQLVIPIPHTRNDHTSQKGLLLRQCCDGKLESKALKSCDTCREISDPRRCKTTGIRIF